MIIGDTTTFGIEFEVSDFILSETFLACGKFMVHLNGVAFGVDESDATMMACSRDEVSMRLARSGTHCAPFSHLSAHEIAHSYWSNFYSTPPFVSMPGFPDQLVKDVFIANRIVWVPDGDSAFDDGSFILHFDIGLLVRLIGFKVCGKRISSLVDVFIKSEFYYGTLERWRSEFDALRSGWLNRGNQ